ncbi:MAG: hypothetical protein ABL918_09190 [Chakrabartia sp.]
MITPYSCASGQEYILRYGEKNPAQIIIIQPFFEEHNRLKQVIVSIMRGLNAAGIGTALPDLPGTGESLIPVSTVTFDAWRAALSAAAAAVRPQNGPLLAMSFRSGALIDDAAGADALWRCAPETGPRVVRDLLRTRLTGGAKAMTNSDGMVDLAGYKLQQSLLDSISAAVPATTHPTRIARLKTDAAPADVQLEGSPVWRRSEPGDDPILCDAIIADVLAWVKTCAAS